MVNHQLAQRKSNLHSCFAYGHPCTSRAIHRQDWNRAYRPRETNEGACKQRGEEGQLTTSVGSSFKETKYYNPKGLLRTIIDFWSTFERQSLRKRRGIHCSISRRRMACFYQD